LKRLFDFLLSLAGLIVASPVLLLVAAGVWLQDRHSPFYIAPRVGKDEQIFRMVKLRSMIVNAAANQVDSTSASDSRITPVGKFIRRFKLDELMQLWNVLIGDMSLVGPRPNVKRETDLYTPVEKKLLAVRPGITDLASIVFADEGDILEGHQDPDLAYNQLIRPWKSRLALLNVENSSLTLDLKILLLTVVAVLSRDRALAGVQDILRDLNADEETRAVALRDSSLEPSVPPGAHTIVESRQQQST
jgi:lipopolysaccharide/colanic/teichoic acid biosynthesis glycosyltransferase